MRNASNPKKEGSSVRNKQHLFWPAESREALALSQLMNNPDTQVDADEADKWRGNNVLFVPPRHLYTQH